MPNCFVRMRKGGKKLMNKQIVAISINKVQSFLFDTILSHTQEKQTEAATLNHIMTASKEISEDFTQKIEETFKDTVIDELLNYSGVYIFQCVLEEDFISEKLNQLFLSYYKESQGKKQLRYVYFSKENLSELVAVKKAKQLLQKPEIFASIVAKNKSTLFSFEKVVDDNSKTKFNEKYKITYPKFVGEINALYKPKVPVDNKLDNSNHFRLAVIKADLDGMGDLFKNIDDYQDYKAISDILDRYVSLDGLHRVVTERFPNNKERWIFPFYVAGDDIFFAVSIANLITGIDVCRYMVDDINNEIQKVSQKYKLSLSIGVEIVFNREPVRYYLSMVEEQLKCAKKIDPKENIKQFVHSKISISRVVWMDIDINKVKEHKKDLKGGKVHKPGCKCGVCKKVNVINRAVGSVPIWRFFLDEVAILNYAKTDNRLKDYVGTSHFFYSLLEKLTDADICNDNIKYINNLLYHLIPKYMDTSIKGNLWKMELLLNRGIIKQLYIKGDKGNFLQLNDEIKQQLKTYLQLMLLLSDARFQINGIEKKGCKFGINEQDNVRKELLNKPMEYLYDLLKAGHGSDLLKFFADYKKLNKKGNHLERLSIDKSMFYKLRSIDKVDINKAASMIELKNFSSRVEIEKKNEVRISENKKPQYIYFDKKGFCETATKCGQWTEDFIDSLMLLYEYNNLLRKYKTRCKDLKGVNK